MLAFLRYGSSLWAKRDQKHCHSISIPRATHQRASARVRVLRLGDREPRPGHIRHAPFYASITGGVLLNREIARLTMVRRVAAVGLSRRVLPKTVSRVAFFFLRVLPVKKNTISIGRTMIIVHVPVFPPASSGSSIRL